jgi:hypothetical protein
MRSTAQQTYSLKWNALIIRRTAGKAIAARPVCAGVVKLVCAGDPILHIKFKRMRRAGKMKKLARFGARNL